MRKKPQTLARMAAVSEALGDGDGLTTQEIWETVTGAGHEMTWSQMEAAVHHLVKSGDVVRVASDDWGQVWQIGGTEQVWPGAGYLHFMPGEGAAA